jgi:hypothetical protein
MFLDQNLTGVIAANVNLSQPLYALMIIALVGTPSAFISALAVLYATRRSQKHEEFMAFHEIAKVERQKRKDCSHNCIVRRSGLSDYTLQEMKQKSILDIVLMQPKY